VQALIQIPMTSSYYKDYKIIKENYNFTRASQKAKTSNCIMIYSKSTTNLASSSWNTSKSMASNKNRPKGNKS